MMARGFLGGKYPPAVDFLTAVTSANQNIEGPLVAHYRPPYNSATAAALGDYNNYLWAVPVGSE